jgi:phospholipid/cholesterol/gamma-HCH transport system permease protein
MTTAAFNIRPLGDGRVLELSGDWSSLTLGERALELQQSLSGVKGPTELDLSQVGRLDTAGAYVILKAALPTLASSPGGDAGDLFALVRPAAEEQMVLPPTPTLLIQLFDKVGRGLSLTGREAVNAAAFAGRLIIELGQVIRQPSKLRMIPLAHVMDSAGVEALPIVLAMNFFIGAVVALVGTNLLSSLGVAVFTVQLVGVAVLREFAILITGILLAGRSASSYAAHIGSMKMTQEIDAMQVIGVDPYEALVVPRVLALLLMMPVLTFAAMIAGILGGLVVSWATLDISPVFFLERMRETVSVRHFWVGMSKAPVLALLIAMAGCRHGLSVEGDVESLGSQVTAAVVQAIFMILLFDAIFAVIYMKLHI